MTQEEKFKYKNEILDHLIDKMIAKYGADSSELKEFNDDINRAQKQLNTIDDALHVKRLHNMHSDEVLRIAKKMSDELPYLIQPSSVDVALAHLYAMYVYKPSLWLRIMRFLKIF
jgi:polyhydroxyalkanoate synthesis regulator phasin